MKKIFWLILIILSIQNLLAQNAKTILIKGKTPNINGNIKLEPYYIDNAYYAGLQFDKSAKIINGEFSYAIKCTDNFPYPVRFVINDTINTGRFYFFGEDIEIKVETLTNLAAPTVSKSCISMDQDRPKFRAGIDKADKYFNKKADSVFTLKKNDPDDIDLNYINNIRENFWKIANSNIKTFVTENRSSPFSFWQLAYYLSNRGYDETYEQSYNELDKRIKNSIQGKVLLFNIKKAKTLAIGAVFPKLKLKDVALKDRYSSTSNLGKKYILVDFWFANCGPCLSNFNRIKDLYNANKNKGFEIIAISNDDTENIQKWQNTIEKQQYNWINLLDENNKYTSSFFIQKFPTNYLLDGNGVILKKDITTIELQKLLTENLK